MTREIKYRVWDNENKSYNDPYSFAYYAMTQDGGLDFYCHGDHMGEANPDTYIVEQYTGLKDKNGKEIYEGDIFRNTINDGAWRISWNGKDSAFWVDSGVAGCSLGDFDWDRNNRKYGFIKKNCEVIGNIHENPELLEKGEENE